MLANIRKYVKSWFALLLLVPVLLSFVLISGNGDVLKFSSSTSVVDAGSRSFDGPDFKREFDARRDEMSQRAQRPVTAEEAVQGGMHTQLLNMIAADESLSEVVNRLGIVPGPAMVVSELRQMTVFFDPLTGKFDTKSYQDKLATVGLTPKRYESMLMDGLGRRHFQSGLGAGFVAPRLYGAFQATYAMETRNVSYFVLDPSRMGAPTQPTEQQLTAFMQENADLLRRPELRQLTIVRFSAKTLAPNAQVDPKEVERVFQFKRDALSTPEMRTLVQIPAKDQATATAIAARMAKGEDPGAVARAYNVQPITLTNRPKTAIPDRKVGEAAFTLAAGQSSGAIRGDLGFAVIKVLSITPGTTPDLATVRPQVEAEVRQRAAMQKVSEAAKRFEDAHNTGKTMAESAAAAGATVISTVPLAAQGVGLDGKPAAGVTPKLIETAFKLSQGAESDIINDGQGEYFIVRVERVIAPALPPMAEVRDRLVQAWMARDYQTRLKTFADSLGARVRKGEPIAAVAISAGSALQQTSGINRIDARKFAETLGGPLINAVFEAKPGEVLVTPGLEGRMLVARLDSTGVGAMPEMAQMAVRGQRQATQQLSEEFSNQIQSGARAVIKPRTHPERALRALGVDAPASAPAAKGKAG